MRFILTGLAALGPLTAPLAACDLCGRTTPPLSYAIKDAKIVVFAQVTGAKPGLDSLSGTSEFKIEAMIKSDPQFQHLRTFTLDKYVPPDPKVKGYLMFLDTPRGRLDPYNGIPCGSDRIVKYLQNGPPWLDAAAADERKADRLLYYFKYLNDPDSAIALDAYKEWAMAGNREVGAVAGRLSADELRNWLLDPITPADRLGLYAFLLGACGTQRDAELLKRFVLAPNDRVGSALDGLLAGLIRLRPDEGWKLVEGVITDRGRPFTQRYSILRLLRFYYGYQPDQYRAAVLRCCTLLLDSDVQDLTVDELRKWQLWDLTDLVLALWGKKEADAPITKRTIVRYGLLCPDPKAKRFVERVRQQDPKLLQSVEESLQFELSRQP